MKLQAEWLDRPGAKQVCAMLVTGGYQALFVGGCIRNELLGEPVADIDIATDALPLKREASSINARASLPGSAIVEATRPCRTMSASRHGTH